MEQIGSAKKREFTGTLGILLACAIWGSSFFMVKGVVAPGPGFLHPWILTSCATGLSALVMFIISKVSGKNPFSNIGSGVTLGIILAFILLPQGFGMQFTTASNSAFITGLFILFVPLINYFIFKRKPAKEVFLSVPVAMIGLWFLTGGIGGINTGDMLTMITAVACAFHVLYADRFIKEGSDPVAISFQQYATVAVCAIIMACLFGRLPEHFAPKTGLVILYLALLPNCAAFFLQFAAQKTVAPFKVSLLFLSESVFAAAFAWTLGGEPFVLMRAAGGALMISAMVMAEVASIRHSAKKP